MVAFTVPGPCPAGWWYDEDDDDDDERQCDGDNKMTWAGGVMVAQWQGRAGGWVQVGARQGCESG